MRHPGRTPPFRTATGDIVPGSIAEAFYLPLGGVDQWVMIRGENLDNPPLIHLHGGPGFSETRLLRHFNADLERRFTVVYWDQRGAGRSFSPTMPRSSMTIEQFISDLDDLVEHVCTRLRRDAVALSGHSWGSALGVLYTRRHPRKVRVYVGSGQIGDWSAADAASYAYTLAEAQRRNNRKAIDDLRAIGRPPYSVRSLWTERMWLQRLDGQLNLRALWTIGRIALGGHESSIFDLPRQFRGFRFSIEAMWDEVSRLNLLAEAPELAVPVCFFLGRRDHFVPPETSMEYFEALTAPSKQLLWFDESGHQPFMDEPAKFNRAMVDIVRPLAV